MSEPQLPDLSMVAVKKTAQPPAFTGGILAALAARPPGAPVVMVDQRAAARSALVAAAIALAVGAAAMHAAHQYGLMGVSE